MPIVVRILIYLGLGGVIASLGAGLVFLTRDGGRSRRTVKALFWRVGLATSLFLLLMLGIATGVIHPHGIYGGH
ncbi:MAG TPA: twin transmembrane helix small protein [Gammaproteobacteria bacterium]|nr:twin transmembrane helix small protein [Gammaproteobacteria bacterium]HYW93644.1 twin transmembrane helix small protein [Gammaproteobacteria bacterium]